MAVAESEAGRPVMIYDGDCGFCVRWIERWRRITLGRIDYEPYQTAASRYPSIDPRAFGRAVHLIEPGGHVTRGAAAVFRALWLAAQRRWPWWAYENVRGFAAVTETVYNAIARHRTAADRVDRLLLGRGVEPTSYQLTRQIFLRLLAVVYAIAFISLWVQIDGLVGSHGIMPVHSFLKAIGAQVGPERFWELPTLVWLNSSDSFLHVLCGGGVAAAMLIIAGIAQLPALVAAFAFYLSLAIAGQDFLSFQWDSLLLEAGFLAIFFAPWQLWRRGPEPSRIILWMLRWLLFRLMFMSGVVKLSSGDLTWHAWTALRYHYMTQPLPTWTSWYFYQAPAWFATFSCGVVFFCELIVPFLICGPRRVRILAMWILIPFQCLIAGTGNYGFFNILAIVLCLLLPDDAFWRWLLRRKPAPEREIARARLRWPFWITAPLSILLLMVTVPICISAFGWEISWPQTVVHLDEWLEPAHIVSRYGLFAIMTTQLPEIEIEGSNDEVVWKPYVFKWRPGDVNEAPRFTTPHMPRLDWQMWFAANDPETEPWVLMFMRRILLGSQPVLDLLRSDPFPEHPPKYLRAVRYDYHFTDKAQRRESGAWWRRERLGIYAELSADEVGASESAPFSP